MNLVMVILSFIMKHVFPRQAMLLALMYYCVRGFIVHFALLN